jgi:hypothetical protein
MQFEVPQIPKKRGRPPIAEKVKHMLQQDDRLVDDGLGRIYLKNPA